MKKDILDIRGHVGKVRKNKLQGWVGSKNVKNPFQVELYINDKFINQTTANIYREDVFLKELHPNGKCGFSFLIDDVPLCPHKIEVKVKNQLVKLNNSIQIQNPKVRTKILVLGLAKSGTSILTYRIAESMENCSVYFEPNSIDQSIDLSFHLDLILKEQRECFVTKLICYPNKYKINSIRLVSKLYTKRIFIIRDPRDLIISSFLYSWNKSHDKKESDFLVALERVKIKESNSDSLSMSDMLKGFISIPQYLQSGSKKMIEILKSLPKDWYILKYEDLVDGKLDELEEYLGVPINNQIEVPQRLSRVVRSKAYGNWRKWFTMTDVCQLKPIFNPILDAMGYDSSDWTLDENRAIDYNEGSNYLTRIFYGEV